MSTECTACHERYPSPYYFVQGATPQICVRCVSALSKDQQEELLETAAASTGETLGKCLRCQTPMMRGDLIYRDVGSGPSPQVREVKWAVARRQMRFLGLVSEWVVERALPLDAWRCKACGYCELATPPDPSEGTPARLGHPPDTDDSTLL